MAAYRWLDGRRPAMRSLGRPLGLKLLRERLQALDAPPPLSRRGTHYLTLTLTLTLTR